MGAKTISLGERSYPPTRSVMEKKGILPLIKKLKGNVFLASADRVAIDAVGLAVLKSLGSNKQIMKTKIFEQEQISRAVEIGLGASSPSEVEIISTDEKSLKYSDLFTKILNTG